VYIFIFVPTCFYAENLSLVVELTGAVLRPLKKKKPQFRTFDSSSPGVKDSEETCDNNKNIHRETHTLIYSTENRWRVMFCV